MEAHISVLGGAAINSLKYVFRPLFKPPSLIKPWSIKKEEEKKNCLHTGGTAAKAELGGKGRENE